MRRSESVLATIDRLDAELISRGQRVSARRKAIQELHRDYDATDVQLRAALALLTFNVGVEASQLLFVANGPISSLSRSENSNYNPGMGAPYAGVWHPRRRGAFEEADARNGSFHSDHI